LKDDITRKLTEEIKKANEIINYRSENFIKNYTGPFDSEIRENIKIAREKQLPLCQDTGMIEFFVFLPKNINIDFDIEDMLNRSVYNAYKENYYRYSTVKDPLFERVNSKDNCPPVIHYMFHDKKNLEIKFLVKGGGSENLTSLFMLKPSSDKETVKKTIIDYIKENGARGCPPLNIGIGIGGTSDKALMLSKLALTYDFDERNEKREYAEFETELTEELNRLKIGFQGLGRGISVYSVHIKQYPTHIAILPVAVSVDCYLVRKGSVTLEI